MNKYLACLIFLMISASGCKEDTLVREMIKKVDGLRARQSETIPQTPYQVEQHHALRDYFLKLNKSLCNLYKVKIIERPSIARLQKSTSKTPVLAYFWDARTGNSCSTTVQERFCLLRRSACLR